MLAGWDEKTDKLLGAIRILFYFLDANCQFLSVRVCKVFISVYCQEAPIRLKYTKFNIRDEIITITRAEERLTKKIEAENEHLSVRDVVKAELNIGQKPSEKSSWPATTADVVDSKRTNRSSKPEVVYRLSDASLLVADRSVTDIASPAVIHQPRASPLTTSLPNLQRPISPTAPQSVDLQDVPPPPLLYNLDDETLSLNNSSEEDSDMEDKSVMPSSFHGKADYCLFVC